MSLEHHPAGQSILVAILDGDGALREQLADAINRSAGLRCISLVATRDIAARAASDQAPDVLLLDESLGKTQATQAIEAIHDNYPDLPIIMLAATVEEELILDSFAQGACGFLLKKSTPERVIEAIHEAYEGGSPMSPEISRVMVKLFQQLGPPDRYDL